MHLLLGKGPIILQAPRSRGSPRSLGPRLSSGGLPLWVINFRYFPMVEGYGVVHMELLGPHVLLVGGACADRL